MFTFNDIAHISLLRVQKQNPSVWVVSTTEIHFLMVWSLGSSSSRCQPIWFLVEDLFLACTGVPLCVLTWQGERVWMSSWVQSLIRTLILLDQGSTLMTSPILNLKIWSEDLEKFQPTHSANNEQTCSEENAKGVAHDSSWLWFMDLTITAEERNRAGISPADGISPPCQFELKGAS